VKKVEGRRKGGSPAGGMAPSVSEVDAGARAPRGTAKTTKTKKMVIPGSVDETGEKGGRKERRKTATHSHPVTANKGESLEYTIGEWGQFLVRIPGIKETVPGPREREDLRREVLASHLIESYEKNAGG